MTEQRAQTDLHRHGSDTIHVRRRGGRFDRFASAIARGSGRASAFVVALAIVVVWAVSGPIFHFSDTWQLVINTGTTVLTFLMVFVIQNTIDRDSMALHVKLDELIRVTQAASDSLIGAEKLTEKQLEQIERQEHRTGASENGAAAGSAPNAS
jgi:low affinity Fe/Cu permease